MHRECMRGCCERVLCSCRWRFRRAQPVPGWHFLSSSWHLQWGSVPALYGGLLLQCSGPVGSNRTLQPRWASPSLFLWVDSSDSVLLVLILGFCSSKWAPLILFLWFCSSKWAPLILFLWFCSSGWAPSSLFLQVKSADSVPLVLFLWFFSSEWGFLFFSNTLKQWFPYALLWRPHSPCLDALGYWCPPGQTVGVAKPCPGGHYCPVGSPAPIPCPAGMYQDREKQAVCLPCEPGERWTEFH